MNQNGVTIQEILMIMVHSLISITEKLHHTQSLRKMFNSMLTLLMNQNGDIIVVILMIMVLSPISITEKLAHILLSRKMYNLVKI